jgi:outer membrane protein assembly factor BamB
LFEVWLNIQVACDFALSGDSTPDTPSRTFGRSDCTLVNGGRYPRAWALFVVWLIAQLIPACGGRVEAEALSNTPSRDAGSPDSPGAPDARDASKLDGSPDTAEQDVVPPPPDAGPKPGDAWRQFGHDARHTGQSASTVASHPSVLWKVTLDNNDYVEMTLVDTDGSLLVAGQLGIYAFDPEGKPRWTIPYTLGQGGGAAILDGGDVVWTEYGDTLFRATRDGDMVYQVPLETVPGLPPTGWASAPTVADDGTLYFVSWRFHDGPSALFSVNSDGTSNWAMFLDEQRGANQPAIDGDGNIVVVVASRLPSYYPEPASDPVGMLIKVSPDGNVLWTTEFDGAADQPRAPSIATDGSIRVALWSPAPQFLAFDPSGGPLAFPFPFSKIVSSTPVIDFAGRTYVCHAGGVITYSTSGELLWQIGAPDQSQLSMGSQAALSADGVLVGSDSQGTLHGIKDGKVLWSQTIGALGGGALTPASVVIGPDGTLYTGTGNHEVIALR